MINIKHPAKYTDALLPVFEEMLSDCKTVLDPFAGTGKIHTLPFNTIGVEIEPEWANMHPNTIVGDATDLQFANCEFDAICTSPTYGNRMADCHNAKDGSSRNTYTHKLGRQLNDNNTGKMQWGDKYRTLHLKAWNECFRVLKNDGVFVLNFKNHIRKGKEVDVFSWHIKELITIGFSIEEIRQVKTNGNGFGQNGKLRTGFEFVAKLRKPKLL
jgi:tRNA G10  N-methylase Trm11